eukprot:c6837_g1_i1.p1 GENE.c6837_g1_i1~~c6837_g1_i1.p1  ORF type:complete len:433 (-),score=68.02 c6837_g1_i1:16-1314(-)
MGEIILMKVALLLCLLALCSAQIFVFPEADCQGTSKVLNLESDLCTDSSEFVSLMAPPNTRLLLSGVCLSSVELYGLPAPVLVTVPAETFCVNLSNPISPSLAHELGDLEYCYEVAHEAIHACRLAPCSTDCVNSLQQFSSLRDMCLPFDALVDVMPMADETSKSMSEAYQHAMAHYKSAQHDHPSDGVRAHHLRFSHGPQVSHLRREAAFDGHSRQRYTDESPSQDGRNPPSDMLPPEFPRRGRFLSLLRNAVPERCFTEPQFEYPWGSFAHKYEIADFALQVCECANQPPVIGCFQPIGEVSDEDAAGHQRGRSFAHFLAFVSVATCLLAVLACCRHRRRHQVTAIAVSPIHMPADSTMMVHRSHVQATALPTPVVAQPTPVVAQPHSPVTVYPANEVCAVSFAPPMTRQAQEKCDEELARRIAEDEYSK